MSAAELPYSHPVPVATLHGQTFLKLTPSPDERAAMAKLLGLESIGALLLEVRVTHAQSGMVTLDGQLTAKVRPICVVTLEAFDQAIDEPVTLRLAPLSLVERLTKRAEDDGVEDFDPPDVIENGEIDFGALTTEFLSLTLDPYPKKPGAAFSGTSDAADEKDNPFAALAALRDRL